MRSARRLDLEPIKYWGNVGPFFSAWNRQIMSAQLAATTSLYQVGLNKN